MNFCRSLTLTLYIFAIEVRVSPRATTWLLPLPLEAEDDDVAGDDVDVVVEVDGVVELVPVASPIMTPGF